MPKLWDFYREVIEGLYLEDDKSLKDVMTIMEQSYGFRASKSQYDIQFKKWRLRKNLNNKEWKFIHNRLENRRRQGKESVVFFNNMLVTDKKVRKEISRHVLPTLSQHNLPSASNPETPPGLFVFTPIEMQAVYPSFMLSNLPWFQYTDYIQIQAGEGGTMFRGDRIHMSSSSFQGGSEIDVEAMSNGLSGHGNPLNIVIDQVPKLLLSQFVDLTWPSANSADIASRAFSQLQSKFCETYSGELMASIQCILGPFSDRSLTQILKFAVYLSSNNLLSGEQRKQTVHFLQWLIDNGHLTTLQSIVKVEQPTIRAFANNIFRTALTIGDVRIVQVLINAGVDLNMNWVQSSPLIFAIDSDCTIDIIRVMLIGGADVNKPAYGKSPLERAVVHGAYEKVKLLLDFGVGVNARLGTETVLQIAVSRHNIELVQVLLVAGADVNDHARGGNSVLYEAVWRNDTGMVQLLLKFGADIYAREQNGTTVFETVSEHGTPEMIQLFLSLVPKGLQMNSDIELFRLQAAVAGGDIASIREYLQRTVDVGIRASLLWTAVGRGQLSLVQLLLDDGVNVNYDYDDGDSSTTLLHEAIFCTKDGYKSYEITGYEDRIKIIQVILLAGADLSAFGPSECGDRDVTPLQAATQAKNLELMRLLINAGADVNAPALRPDGITALQAAVYSEIEAGDGDFKTVQLLLEAGADVNAPAVCPFGWTALQRAIAAESGNLDVMRLLLARGGDVNAVGGDWRTPLQVALSRENVEMAWLLLSAGANVNPRIICRSELQPHLPERTPLQLAAIKGDIEMTQFLLGAGANVNAPASCLRGTTALQAAIGSSLSEDKTIELVSILLIAGADVNAQGSLEGSDALQAAAKRGSLKLVQLLLGEGANINAPGARDGGRTALQAGVEEGHSAIVRLLLDKGAKVNAPPSTIAGRTALQAISTAPQGNLEIVQLLLVAGADVNARPAWSKGLTALQGAAIRGHTQVAIVLLENGADVNAEAAAKDGRTALEGAAEHGRLDMVQLLLNAGAESHKSEASRYLTAIKFARQNGQPDTAALLLACRNTQ